MSKIIITMGSKADLEYAEKFAGTLKNFGVDYVMRIASAHKVPEKALGILREYSGVDCVYITIAGMSNALSGFVDANTHQPVIASPPYSEKFGGMDIFSSLRMPSGVCPMTVLGAGQAALAAVKILSLNDDVLKEKIKEYQDNKKNEIEKDDKDLQNNG